jgi:hypothetical protein
MSIHNEITLYGFGANIIYNLCLTFINALTIDDDVKTHAQNIILLLPEKQVDIIIKILEESIDKSNVLHKMMSLYDNKSYTDIESILLKNMMIRGHGNYIITLCKCNKIPRYSIWYEIVICPSVYGYDTIVYDKYVSSQSCIIPYMMVDYNSTICIINILDKLIQNTYINMYVTPLNRIKSFGTNVSTNTNMITDWIILKYYIPQLTQAMLCVSRNTEIACGISYVNICEIAIKHNMIYLTSYIINNYLIDYTTINIIDMILSNQPICTTLAGAYKTVAYNIINSRLLSEQELKYMYDYFLMKNDIYMIKLCLLYE